jgi:hypothetical protein
MKRLIVALITVFLVTAAGFSTAGQPARTIGNLDPAAAQPNSHAFGKTLDAWMEAYIRWWEDGADPAARVKNVAFLPIEGESPFEVSVEPGTALVLPIATWLAFPGEEPLPDDWWGDPNHIFGHVHLNGQAIAEPNVEYYVGPTYLDPPASLFGFDIALYQALVVVIKPLPAGDHELVLHSEFVDFGAVFDNVWNITVEPPGRKK